MANTRENLRMLLIVRNSHEDHSKVSPPTIRVTTLSKTKACWWGCGEIRILVPSWWNCKAEQLFYRPSMVIPQNKTKQNLKLKPQYDSDSPFLGISNQRSWNKEIIAQLSSLRCFLSQPMREQHRVHQQGYGDVVNTPEVIQLHHGCSDLCHSMEKVDGLVHNIGRSQML